VNPLTQPAIVIENRLSDLDERALANDVLDGLTRPFKELPPKHLYDTRGSELFDQICGLPEYYPTRAESEILAGRAGEHVHATGARELVELGSGTAEKTRVLLGAMDRAGRLDRYVPLDVSEAVVERCAEELVSDYASLSVHGVVGDFERHLGSIPPRPASGGRLVALLGGTIGNFTPGSRRRFLRRIARLLGPGDALLLGADLVKDPAVIEAAYNDRAGVTAEFNRNVLHVVNRELDANFAPEAFEHVAFFDRRHEWIEMRLRALHACEVSVPGVGLRIGFEAGEELRTEISAKFTRSRIEADLAAAGLALDVLHTDARELFSLSVARPAAA
jgi:L-histidine N-alpha-methyltransferase